MKTVKKSVLAKSVKSTNVPFATKQGNVMIVKFDTDGLYVYNVKDMSKPVCKVVEG